MLSPSLILAAVFLFLLLRGPITVRASSASSTNCVEEFGQCVTNRDCCGREEHLDRTVECVTGDWEVTTDSTCLSKRSQELDALSKENCFDHQTLTVLLKHHIYQHPEIREQQTKRFREKEIDPLFYEKIADKYRHDFAKLIVSLERKYKMNDATAMPTLIREFLTWEKTVDIAEVFAHGIPEKEETTKENDTSKAEF
jgi:hypothetical protein